MTKNRRVRKKVPLHTGGMKGVVEKEGATEIWNMESQKKVFKPKMLFPVITKKWNWEILTKNLVSFKRWDGVKDEKF